MGWTVPLQQASFAGIRFDVINISDHFERSVVEHAYPFVNGADLEDMGLKARQVQLQAVFFGKGYRVDLDKLITVLQKSGTDVLVHPILGRMPNMLCTSASLRHGDDFVDYVAFDLTFIEATPSVPIFTLDHSLWGEIDRLVSQLEAFEEKIVALCSQSMLTALLQNAKTRLLKVWSSLVGVYESITLMFNADTQKYTISAGVSFQHVEKSTVKALQEIHEMIQHALFNVAFPPTPLQTNQSEKSAALFSEQKERVSNVFTVRSRFDELVRETLRLKHLPHDLVSGKNDSVKRAAKLSLLMATFSEADMRETACAVQLMCTTALIRIGVEMIETNAEQLLPSDIEYIAQHIRLAIAESLSAVRALQQQDLITQQHTTQQNTEVYYVAYQTIEQLREFAHHVSRIALAAINRKPPLMLKISPLTGTIQQVAHAFYGDYTRAEELLRLNPQIKHPNFIQQGEIINAYSK